MVLLPDAHRPSDDFEWREWQTRMLDSFVIASCVLSIMGSLFIILSYLLWKDLRTTPRFMLVCLSFADLVTASGNMFGAIYRSGGTVCTIQSAFTSTSSISSFLWTVSIGMHLYLSILKRTRKMNLQWVYHTISWGLPLVILVIALSFGALGADEFSRAVGWCWISEKVDYPLFWSFFVGKAEEIASYILTLLLYTLTLMQLHRRVDQGLLPSKNVRKVIGQVDRKLMLVPIVFIFVRLWGTARFILVTAGWVDTDLYWFVVVQGVGDSAQGFANFLLFCVFTKKVRSKYVNLFRRLLCVPKYKDIQAGDDDDDEHKGSIQYDEDPNSRLFLPGARLYYSDADSSSSMYSDNLPTRLT